MSSHWASCAATRLAIGAGAIAALTLVSPRPVLAQAAWTPIELGTLGGTSIDTSAATAVNNGGAVAGDSTINGQTHAFLWTAAGGMQDLGTLGGASSAARGINDSRQVVGAADLGPGVRHAFLWTSSAGMIDLGTLGGTASEATAINNVGQVVGTSLTAGGERHPFLWSSSTGMVDMASSLGASSSPMAINDAGQIVGNRPVPQPPFSWTPSGGLVSIVGATDAVGVNAAGAVTGSRPHPAFFEPYPYIWTAGGGIQTVGFGSRGADINDRGEIVANPYDPPNNAIVFLPPAYGPTPHVALGPLPSTTAAFGRLASAISNAGAVGQAPSGPTATPRRAAFWCRPGAPTLTAASATPDVLSPADGRLVTVNVSYDVTTTCLATFTSTLSVTSDETLDPSDVVVVDEHTLRLRASRADSGDGRTYSIRIRVVDAAGTEATADVTVTVPLGGGPMTGVTLTTDLGSPQPSGTTITLLAAGSGGIPPYEYRFWIQPWGGTWQLVRNWSPSSTYAWTPALAGGYNLSVEARAGGSTSVDVQSAIGFTIGTGGGGGGGGPMTGVSLTTHLASPQPGGTPIQLTAAGSGGTMPYSYRFWIQPWGGAWSLVRDWDPAATYVWTPTAAGGYNLSVEARGAGATTAEVQTATGFTISPGGGGPMDDVTLTTSLPSPQTVGTTIMLMGAGIGGSMPYAYRFWIQPWGGSWMLVRDWSPSPGYAWTPTAAGGYNVTVEARGSTSAVGEVQRSTGFTINPAPAVNSGGVASDAPAAVARRASD